MKIYDMLYNPEICMAMARQGIDSDDMKTHLINKLGADADLTVAEVLARLGDNTPLDTPDYATEIWNKFGSYSEVLDTFAKYGISDVITAKDAFNKAVTAPAQSGIACNTAADCAKALDVYLKGNNRFVQVMLGTTVSERSDALAKEQCDAIGTGNDENCVHLLGVLFEANGVTDISKYPKTIQEPIPYGLEIVRCFENMYGDVDMHDIHNLIKTLATFTTDLSQVNDTVSAILSGDLSVVAATVV